MACRKRRCRYTTTRTTLKRSMAYIKRGAAQYNCCISSSRIINCGPEEESTVQCSRPHLHYPKDLPNLHVQGYGIFHLTNYWPHARYSNWAESGLCCQIRQHSVCAKKSRSLQLCSGRRSKAIRTVDCVGVFMRYRGQSCCCCRCCCCCG